MIAPGDRGHHRRYLAQAIQRSARSIMQSEDEDDRKQQQLRMAISRLSKRQRTALVLCKFDGLSYDEAAIKMNLSVSAIKSLLCRARLSLLKQLE